MSLYNFFKHKPLEITSITGSPVISRAICIKIIDGDDSTTGTGTIILDWTNISSKADIGIYDENNNLLDYYFESFDSAAKTAIIWIYRSWTRDGSVQLKVAYGNGPSDQSVSASTVFDKENNIVSGWLLNESSGNALDVTSNNLDASVYGSPTRNSSGIVGPTYSFDGSNDELAADATGLLNESNLENGFTLSAWIKTAQTSNRQDIMGRLYSGGNSSFGLSLNRKSQNVGIYLDDGGTKWEDGVFEYTADTWFKVDFIYDTTQIFVYVNGNQELNLSAGSSLSSNPSDYFYIGSNWGERYFQGKLDNIFVWQTYLNSNEILAKYQSEKSSPSLFNQQSANINAIDIDLPAINTENKFTISQLSSNIIIDFPVINSENKFFIESVGIGYKNIVCTVDPYKIASVINISTINIFRIINTQ